MTAIATSVTVLSASLFVAALLKILAPIGSTEKAIRLVISLFVLICIVTCFKSVADAVEIPDSQSNENINSAVDESVLKVTGDYMAEYVESLLLAEDINADKIEVTVNVDENQVINITDISIYIDKSQTLLQSKITEIIETDLNITPKVKIKEQ